MEIYKWIAGVIVGAFLAGVSVIIFLDKRIDSNIATAISPVLEKLNEHDKEIEIAGSEFESILWELPKSINARHSAHQEQELNLGKHQFCFLSKVYSQILNGSTSCRLVSESGEWKLYAFGTTPSKYDGTKRGNAECSAICGSVQK